MAERNIDGEDYRFDKLNPFAGIRLAGRVMKFFGPAWGYIDGLFDQDEEERDKQALIVFGMIIQDLDVMEMVDFLKELCGYCQIKMNGKYEPVVPEHHMRSEMEVFKVALFVLEVQCRDFFAAAASSPLGAAINSRMASTRGTPPTS